MKNKKLIIFYLLSILILLFTGPQLIRKTRSISNKISEIELKRKTLNTSYLKFYPKFIIERSLAKVGLYSKESLPDYLTDKIVLDDNWGIYIADVCCNFPEDYSVSEVIKLNLETFVSNSNQETDLFDPFVLKKLNNSSYKILFETVFFDNNNELNVVLNESLITGEGDILSNKIIYDPIHKISYPITIKDNKNGYLIALEETQSRFKNTGEKGYPGFYKYSNGFCSEENCSEKNAFYPIHVALFDPSIIFKDNLYYVLATDIFGNLRLFYGENLLSDNSFREHPKSPITNNPNYNRNAGRIFHSSGNLYRPSMQNEKRYGQSINLNKINKLSTTEYEESIYKNDFLRDSKFSKILNNGYYHHLEFLIDQDFDPNIRLPKGKIKLLLDGAKINRYRLHGKDIQIMEKQ